MLISNNHTKSEFLISIESNTNKIVSSSEDSFAGITKGSYVKIGNSDILYPINKTNKFLFLKDFKVINSKEFLIKGNSGINLQINDSLDLIFDEYEMSALVNIINGGQFYSIGESLYVAGGETSVDMSSGFTSPTKFKVEEIGLNGDITKLSLENNGKYILPPTNQCFLISEKQGVDAKLDLIYNIVSDKRIIKRVIKEIDHRDNNTYIKLDYSLPLGAKSGKLSVEKWEIELSNIFLDKTQFCVPYRIIKDFTSYCNFPLMVKNTLTPDLIYNKSINMIDNEINSLKEQIKELTKLIKNGS